MEISFTNLHPARRLALLSLVGWNLAGAIICGALPMWEQLLSLHYPSGAASAGGALIVDLFRLFSYTFIHSGWGHLCANMVWLLIFGWSMYPLLGLRRFCLLYFGSGACGGLAFLLAAMLGGESEPLTLCGASSATLGVALGAAILERHTPLCPGLRLPRLRKLTIPALAIPAILLTLLANPHLYPTAAHCGGLLFALIFSLLSRPSSSSQRPSSPGPASADAPGVKFPSSSPGSASSSLEEIKLKLRQSGFDSLTAAERQALKESSPKGLLRARRNAAR